MNHWPPGYRSPLPLRSWIKLTNFKQWPLCELHHKTPFMNIKFAWPLVKLHGVRCLLTVFVLVKSLVMLLHGYRAVARIHDAYKFIRIQKNHEYTHARARTNSHTNTHTHNHTAPTHSIQWGVFVFHYRFSVVIKPKTILAKSLQFRYYARFVTTNVPEGWQSELNSLDIALVVRLRFHAVANAWNGRVWIWWKLDSRSWTQPSALAFSLFCEVVGRTFKRDHFRSVIFEHRSVYIETIRFSFLFIR